MCFLVQPAGNAELIAAAEALGAAVMRPDPQVLAAALQIVAMLEAPPPLSAGQEAAAEPVVDAAAVQPAAIEVPAQENGEILN